MAATLEATLDTAGYGTEIGARIYLLTAPESQVGADIVLAQGSVLHRYSASLPISTYAAGEYRADIYRSASGTLGAFLSSGYVRIVDGVICRVGGSDFSRLNSQLESLASGVTAIQDLSALASPLPSGYVEIADDLVVGDDYTSGVGRELIVQLVDAAGDALDITFGAKTLADAGVDIQMLLKPSGRSSGSNTLTGACSFTPSVGETPAFLTVSLPRTVTALAVPGPYDLQVEAIWPDGDTVTLFPFGQVMFTKDIQRSA